MRSIGIVRWSIAKERTADTHAALQRAAVHGTQIPEVHRVTTRETREWSLPAIASLVKLT